MMWKSIASAAVMGLLLVGPAKASQSEPNLYESAQNNGSLDTFVAAVNAAGLADSLKGEDSFTVFAPTDEAFAALPDGTVEALLEPENKDELVALLKNHIVVGKNFVSAWAGEKAAVQTKAGNELQIDGRTGNPFMVGDARIIQKNIPAGNGVIHALDGVLLEPAS